MVDIAGTVAQNFQPGIYGNVLAKAQYLNDARQRNEMRKYEFDRQKQTDNALAGGDVNALARLDPQMAGQYQGVQNTQRKAALETMARMMDAVGKSKSPKALAAQVVAMPDFQSALQALQIDPGQFTVDDNDTDDSLRQQAMELGRVFGAIPSRLENPNIPSNVRVAEYYAGLPPSGTEGVTREVFNEANRAPTIREIGGVQTAVGPGNATTQLGTLPGEANAARVLADARASGTATGGAQGAAQAGLPDTLADINKMRRDIQGFTTHPGFTAVYGKSRPLTWVPGSDAANAEARRNTLDAEAFGVTIQKMRGLGALSNAEGEKVTAAFTHATNPKIGEDEAEKAWDDVLYYLDLAEQRAAQKAQGGRSAPAEDNDPLGLR